MLLSLNVFRDEVHGPRTIQGYAGNDVLQISRLQPLHEAAHARRLELEHTGTVAGGKHVINPAVVQGHAVKIDFHSMILLRIPDSILNHRQSTQSQEIHFQQSQLFNGGHGELGGDGPVGAPGQRHVVHHRCTGNHHAGGMHGGMSGQTLQTLRHGEDLLGLLILLGELPKLCTHLQCLVQRHAEIIGNELGDHIALGIGDIQYAAHIPYHTLGRQGTEGDDLGHLILAVLLRDIVNDLLTALVLEVHVDIRHGNSLRVQESLEDQIIADGVNVGDADGIGHDGACRRASAGSHGNIMGLCKMNVVPYDQEVVDEAHGADDRELILQTLPVLLRRFAVAIPETVLTELPKIALRIEARRHRIMRQMIVSELNLHLTAFCDAPGVLNGLLRKGEK